MVCLLGSLTCCGRHSIHSGLCCLAIHSFSGRSLLLLLLPAVFFQLSGVVPMESTRCLVIHSFSAHLLQSCCCCVCLAVFFQLSGVVPMESAVPLLKESIRKAYGKKGEKVVMQNCAAVDGAVSALIKIEVPAAWANATDAPEGRLGHSHTPAAQVGRYVAFLLFEVIASICC
jgi:hypothetical protein